jgi:hypothetical protein
MKKLIILFCLITVSNMLLGQAREAEDNVFEGPKQNIGIGLGLDYGGVIGFRYTYMVAPKFGMFGSLGYVLVGPGFNFGATYKFSPDKKVTPTLGAMYGYNAAIKVVGASEFDKIYYGPSFSFGVEVKTRRNEKNFWNFELVLPIRSSEYKDDMDALLNNPDIDISEGMPIAFSIGYHFGF